MLWLPSPGAGLLRSCERLRRLRSSLCRAGLCSGRLRLCGATAYAPIVYATPIAPAPISVGYGCGACGTPTAAVTFVPQVAPTPTYGCGGCGSPAVYNAPAPLYVVNQGPDFSGPGVTVPYRPTLRRHNTLRLRTIRRIIGRTPTIVAARLAVLSRRSGLLPACVLSSACVLRWTALRAPLLARLNPASPITKCKGPLRRAFVFLST